MPDRDRASVPLAKIADYLLSRTHPVGRHKAAFFLEHGFSADLCDELGGTLVRHAEEHEVLLVEVVPFGMKYVIDGILQTPDGRSPMIRSVWIIERDETTPRLVTAYPRPRS